MEIAGARALKDTGRVMRPFDRLRVTGMRLLRCLLRRWLAATARNDRRPPTLTLPRKGGGSVGEQGVRREVRKPMREGLGGSGAMRRSHFATTSGLIRQVQGREQRRRGVRESVKPAVSSA